MELRSPLAILVACAAVGVIFLVFGQRRRRPEERGRTPIYEGLLQPGNFLPLPNRLRRIALYDDFLVLSTVSLPIYYRRITDIRITKDAHNPEMIIQYVTELGRAETSIQPEEPETVFELISEKIRKKSKV